MLPIRYLRSKNCAKAICARRIRGMPTVNLMCLVLWRTVYIPIRAPMLPPRRAAAIRVAYGIRLRFFLALYLSISISAKAIALIISR